MYGGVAQPRSLEMGEMAASCGGMARARALCDFTHHTFQRLDANTSLAAYTCCTQDRHSAREKCFKRCRDELRHLKIRSTMTLGGCCNAEPTFAEPNHLS